MPPFETPDLSEAAARRQTWGALGVLLAAFVVAFLPDGAQQAVASSLRYSVLRPFLALQQTLVRARLHTQEVERLRAELDTAQVALLNRATLEAENARLRSLLALSARLGTEYEAAVAIRPGTTGSESMFILDVGSDQGVQARAPVVTREGLAGVVREVRETTAIGMDWTHPDFRASAMTLDGLTYGFVESRRGIFRESDRLVLTGTPYSTNLVPGSVIVTSGLGGVFPRGIPIGRVDTLAVAEGGWRKSYWLQPFVDVGSISQVLVAVGDPSTRRIDVGEAFPPDEAGTASEYLARQQARADSLARLSDEVRRLRARLDSLRRGPSGGEAPAGGVR